MLFIYKLNFTQILVYNCFNGKVVPVFMLQMTDISGPSKLTRNFHSATNSFRSTINNVATDNGRRRHRNYRVAVSGKWYTSSRNNLEVKWTTIPGYRDCMFLGYLLILCFYFILINPKHCITQGFRNNTPL